MENIKLNRVDEPKSDVLPRNVKLIMLGDKMIFAKRTGVHFMPLPESEQEILRKKHILK